MSQDKPNETAFDRQGAGPGVALIHGLGLNRSMWQWQLPSLAAHFEVLTYDLLGHGGSAGPSGMPDLTMFSDQLLRLLDACGMERAAIVGFSLGGMIARRFAVDHPDRCRTLAILHSAHDRTPAEREAVRGRVRQVRASGPSVTVDAALERWFTPAFRNANPDLMALVRDWILANDAAVYPDVYHVLAEGDAEIAGSIKSIACPTLVMTGGADSGNTPDMARRMAALIPGARAVILPGVRHMSPVEAPRAVSACLSAFLLEALDPGHEPGSESQP